MTGRLFKFPRVFVEIWELPGLPYRGGLHGGPLGEGGMVAICAASSFKSHSFDPPIAEPFQATAEAYARETSSRGPLLHQRS